MPSPAARGRKGRARGYDPAMGQTRKGKSLAILAARNMSGIVRDPGRDVKTSALAAFLPALFQLKAENRDVIVYLPGFEQPAPSGPFSTGCRSESSPPNRSIAAIKDALVRVLGS